MAVGMNKIVDLTTAAMKWTIKMLLDNNGMHLVQS